MKCSALPLLCLLAALSFTTTVTAQAPNPLFRHIPPDAEQVYHINLAALGSKISWDDVVNTIPPPKAASDEEVMKYVKDPSLSGIDFHQGILVASGHLAKNSDSAGYITILIQLTDSGKALKLVRSAVKGLRTFRLPGKASVAGKDKIAFAWNDKLAVVTIIDPGSKQIHSVKGKAIGVSPYYTLTAAKKSAAALEGFAGSVYTTDATFINGFSDDADFHIWSPQGSFVKQLSELSKKKNPLAGSGIKVPQTVSQLHTLTAFRFEAGKITLRSTTVIPPDSAQLYKMYTGHPLNTDLITHLPGQAVLGMVNMHFDPSGLKYILQHYHAQHLVDSLLSHNGLAMDDVLKAFKGDFLFAGMQPGQLPDTGKAKPNIYFATTIGDMGAFMKVIGKLGLTSDSSGGMLAKMKAGYTLRNNILVVGAKGQTEAFFNTNNPDNLSMVNDRVRTNAFSIAIDIKAIIAFMKAGSSEPSQKTQQMLHFLNALDRMTYTAGSYQNGITEGYFELKMADPSENSLRSLFKLLH